MDRRTFCMLTAAGAIAPVLAPARADERSSKNVIVTFPPPIPEHEQLRAAIVARFAGNYAADGYGLSRSYEALQRAAARTALGPRLQSGSTAYVLIADTSELLHDGIPANGRFTARDFRAVYAFGRAPYVLVARTGTDVASPQELPDVARRRAAAGRPVACDVQRGLGHQLANRLARLIGAPLMLAIHPLPPHPDNVRDSADSELAIMPLGPLLLARAREGRLRMLVALTTSARPVSRTLDALGASGVALPTLTPDGAYASLGIVPTLGAFVARDESEDSARRLHAAFAASAEEPGLRRFDITYPLEEVGTPERAAAWYEAERTRLEALARGA